MPLIVKNQSFVRTKIKNSVGKFGVVGLRWQQRKTTAHPQMDDQGLVITEVKENMFAATMDEIYSCFS